MNGFWQSARNFFAGREAETTPNALTREGQALGFEWEMSRTRSGLENEGSALLWPDASQAMEIGPLAGVDYDHDCAEWTMNGEHHGIGKRKEAMQCAEQDAAGWVIEQMAEASESYHAKLAALAESRGAETNVERGRGLEL